MLKLGKILFLVALFLLFAGFKEKTSAQTLTPTAGLNLLYTNTISEFDHLSQKGLSRKFAIVQKKTESKKPEPKITPKVVAVAYQAPRVITQASQAATTTPTPQPQINLDPEKIFNMVNEYRTSNGFAPFEKNDEVCNLAQIRSSELINESQNGSIHAGLYNRLLPYWIWENAKYGSDEVDTVAWWIASWLHKSSILGDYRYSCVRTTGNFVSQLFTSFVPK